MGEFGEIVLIAAMVLSAMGGALTLGGSNRPAISAAGRRLLGAAALAGGVSLLILIFLLVGHDYRLSYVHEYANRNMPLGYLITAVWGGQQGSLLLWAVLQTWFTAVLALFSSRKPAFAIGFLAALQTFFLALVLFHSNPFDFLPSFEMEGIGMNPLLLNPFMTIHPPTLFLGFVGFSVPFALALDALAEGRDPDHWIEQARPWTLFAWLFLSIGNLVGMVWAYQELGWGGYWGWDPVENASFMPWLTGTAFLHTAMVQQQRKLHRVLNGTLAMLTFTLIIFGTFITRSGVIQSVHSFAGATVGPYLLGLIIFSVALFTGLAIYRRKDLAFSPPDLRLLSKENLLFVSAWLLLISAAFVWIGTMAPLFTELFRGEKVASTPAFFNRWMVPLGLATLAMLGACVVLSKKHALRKWIAPGIAATATTSTGLAMFGWKGIFAAIAFALVGFVGAVSVERLWRTLRGASSSSSLSSTRKQRLGAYIVHISVVVLFLGFAGSAYTVEASTVLHPKQSLRVGPYDITYLGFHDETDFLRSARFANLRVRRNGAQVGVFSAARFFYHSHPKQPTSEVEINTTLKEDLFLILGKTDDATGAASIRAVVNPLVVWIWIGGAILVFGVLISLMPRPRFSRLRQQSVRLGLPVLTTATLLVITCIIKGLLMAIAAGIGVGLIGLVLLLGQSLISLGDEVST